MAESKTIHITTPLTEEVSRTLRAGDSVLITGKSTALVMLLIKL